MQFRHLRYFVKVVEAGSFSRAAEAIHVAQPALSQQIAQLEEQLGLKLLQRTPRGVKTTSAGDVLYREASAILLQMEQLAGLVRGGGGEIDGIVNVGVSSTLLATLPVAFLSAAKAAYPKVTIRLAITDSPTLKARVETNTLDLAVVFEDEFVSTFSRLPLFRQRLYLVPREVISGHRDTIHVKQLADRSLVLPTAANITRTAISRVFAAAGVSPNVVAEIDVVANMLAAVRNGIGDTILPKGDLSDMAGNDLLKPLLIEPPAYLTCSIVTSPDFPLAHAGDAMRTLLAKFTRDHLRKVEAPGVEFI
jgi:LysR family transcriptional regulator, nitrogen assimilation regulatory protein